MLGDLDSIEGRDKMRSIHLKNLDTFTQSYIATALWSSFDNLEDGGGYPLDKKYTIDDIESTTLDKMIKDCKDFQNKYGQLFFEGGWEDDDAGHDFWLTRNRHGAGFWSVDEDKNEEIGKQLTRASHAYGEFNLYLGDGRYDGLVCGG